MRRLIITTALSAVLAVAACTSDEGDANGPPSGDSPTASQEESPGESSGDSLQFNETFTYENGLSIAITTPETFIPSAEATTSGEPDFVKFDVHLTNGTDTAVVPGDIFVSVQSDGGSAGDVTDPANDLTGPPTEPVEPGAEATWTMGFGVLDPADLTVEVQPGLDLEPVTFGG